MNDDHIPQLDADLAEPPSAERLDIARQFAHKPRILLLYGSNRERSFSRLLTEEAARLITDCP